MTHLDDFSGLVRIRRDVETGAPVAIRISDPCTEVADGLSPELARALAQKLISAADECERHKPLRRLTAIEDQLRGLDD